MYIDFMANMIARIKQKLQRRFKHIGHFKIIQLEIQQRLHQTNNGDDTKAGYGSKNRQAADDFHL